MAIWYLSNMFCSLHDNFPSWFHNIRNTGLSSEAIVFQAMLRSIFSPETRVLCTIVQLIVMTFILNKIDQMRTVDFKPAVYITVFVTNV